MASISGELFKKQCEQMLTADTAEKYIQRLKEAIEDNRRALITTTQQTKWRDTMKRTEYITGQKESGLKVGDKVRIMRKAHDHENGWNNDWHPDMDEYIGRTGTIKRIADLKGVYIHGWEFPYFVLKKVVNAELPDYVPTREKMTLDNFLDEETMCREWQDRLVKKFGKYGLYEEIPFNEVIQYAEEVGKISWLIENEYIREKEEITYSVGDWFRDKKTGDYYWLVQTGHSEITLINTSTANRKTDPPVKVYDVLRITQKEFNKLGRGIQDLEKANAGITIYKVTKPKKVNKD